MASISTATPTTMPGPGGESACDTPGTWSVGIVNHGRYDDLSRNLDALERQTHPPTAVAVYDTGVDANRFEALLQARPRMIAERGDNIGYAAGANRVLRTLREVGERSKGRPAPDFLLLLNADIELDPDFGEKLCRTLERNPRAAIATGKLLRRDGELIDSAGIRFARTGRPLDRGSEEPDRGQYDRSETVDAASGAAMMIRSAALACLEIEGELFDESFFAYYEDTDLCWRARRLGWEIIYEPGALAIHARGWQKDRRDRIPAEIRRHSFKNHSLQLVKNQTALAALRDLPWLLAWAAMRFGFALFRDPTVLRAYGDALKLVPQAWRKRRSIRARARDPRFGPPADGATRHPSG